MAKLNIMNRGTWGDAILERFTAQTVPPLVRPYLKSFRDQHAIYLALAKQADGAHGFVVDAEHSVAAADAVLDAAIGELAVAMVGAKMGPRNNPFPKPHKAPSEIMGLPYAKEVTAVRALVERVRKSKPLAPAVSKALDACERAAAGVAKTLGSISKPSAAWARARDKRDALSTDWSRALERLRLTSQTAWINNRETAKSLFAPADALQSPVTKRRAKKPSGKATPATPPG